MGPTGEGTYHAANVIPSSVGKVTPSTHHQENREKEYEESFQEPSPAHDRFRRRGSPRLRRELNSARVRRISMRHRAWAAVVLAILIACSPGDSGAGDTAASSTEPGRETSTTTTTQIAVTTTTTPPAPSPPVLGGWRWTGADPATFGNATVTDAEVVGDRIIAVGCERDRGESLDVDGGFPVWISDDGETWTRANGPSRAGQVGTNCLTDLVDTQLGLFVDGSGLLYSADGSTWEPVELRPGDGYLGWVDAIFATTERVTVLMSRAAMNETTVASLITTTDGEAWEEGPADSAALFDNSRVADVLIDGDRILAVGASPWGEFVPTAAVWSSSGGLIWQLVTPRGAGFADSYMRAIEKTDQGYLAVGGAPFETGLLAAWTSSDGEAWDRLPPPTGEVAAEFGFMEGWAITEIDGVFYVGGTDFDADRSEGRHELPALWSSPDGATWKRVDPEEDPRVVPFNVIAFKDRKVGFWPPPSWPGDDPVWVLTSDAGGG